MSFCSNQNSMTEFWDTGCELVVEQAQETGYEDLKKVLEAWRAFAREQMDLVSPEEAELFEDAASISGSIVERLKRPIPNAQFHYCVDPFRQILGVAVFLWEPATTSSIEVEFLVSDPVNLPVCKSIPSLQKIRGVGTLLLKQAEKIVASDTSENYLKKVVVEPIKNAVSFYKRQGFEFEDEEMERMYKLVSNSA